MQLCSVFVVVVVFNQGQTEVRMLRFKTLGKLQHGKRGLLSLALRDGPGLKRLQDSWLRSIELDIWDYKSASATQLCDCKQITYPCSAKVLSLTQGLCVTQVLQVLSFHTGQEILLVSAERRFSMVSFISASNLQAGFGVCPFHLGHILFSVHQCPTPVFTSSVSSFSYCSQEWTLCVCKQCHSGLCQQGVLRSADSRELTKCRESALAAGLGVSSRNILLTWLEFQLSGSQLPLC